MERSEYYKLKNMMLRISRQPDNLLEAEVEKLKAIEFKSEKLTAIRKNCCEAYDAYLEANRKSREAQDIIGEIEHGLQTELSVDQVMAMKDKAQSLLDESDVLLEKAGKLKNDCYEAMEEMEKPHR